MKASNCVTKIMCSNRKTWEHTSVTTSRSNYPSLLAGGTDKNVNPLRWCSDPYGDPANMHEHMLYYLVISKPKLTDSKRHHIQALSEHFSC